MTMDRVNPDVYEYTLERDDNTHERKHMATQEIFSGNNIMFLYGYCKNFDFNIVSS